MHKYILEFGTRVQTRTGARVQRLGLPRDLESCTPCSHPVRTFRTILSLLQVFLRCLRMQHLSGAFLEDQWVEKKSTDGGDVSLRTFHRQEWKNGAKGFVLFVSSSFASHQLRTEQ